jgi:HEAT repeat protein
MRLIAGWTLLVAGLPGCAGGHPAPDVPPLGQVLAPLDLSCVLWQPSDPVALRDAAESLRNHLAHPDWQVREAATAALESLGPDSIHFLALLYPDTDAEVSWRVRKTLRRLGWPDERLVRMAAVSGTPAAPLIASVLREETIERAGPAIRALGEIGGAPAREAAEVVAQDPEPRARYHAARALGLIGDREGVPALDRLKQDTDQGVRYAAAGALMRLGHKEGFEATSTALQAQAVAGGAVHLYNLACLQALAGRTEAACAWMTKAFEAGFRDVRSAAMDPDLYDLRGLPSWQALLRRMERAPFREE